MHVCPVKKSYGKVGIASGAQAELGEWQECAKRKFRIRVVILSAIRFLNVLHTITVLDADKV